MKTKTEDLTGKRLYGVFRNYKNGKAELDDSLKENEKWWRAQGTEQSGATTPYLFNAIWNKHAGAMDNFPEPTFLERELADKMEAERLTSIVPLILDRNCFYGTYSDAWWRKLKNGFAVYFVFWDKELENGLGDVGIRCIDGLRFYAEPYCENIQKSKYVFVTSEMDRKAAEKRYPKVDFKKPEEAGPRYFHEKQDEDSVQIIDCYERVAGADGCVAVHLTKLYGETVLYSTVADPLLKDCGLYGHGLYPFVIDTMIPLEKSLYGMGLLGLGGSMQGSIDRLDQLIEKNSLVSARQRFLLKRSAGVDRNALLDMNNDVVEADSTVDDGAVRPIQAAPLPAGVLQSRITKAEDLKEVLGNRDFQQGSVTGGVTAYSAIVALQESGNKLERDLIAASYESFRQMVELVVELIRQFYTEERVFRITGQNLETTYLAYANDGLLPRPCGERLYRKPVFDIKITAQKQSPFSTAQHNELCMQLYKLGAFSPENAPEAAILLNNLILPGKENLLRAVKENLDAERGEGFLPVQ